MEPSINQETSNVELQSCPICGHTTFRQKLEVIDRFYSQEIFKLKECIQCGFLCTNPRPKNEKLPEYYNSSEYVSHGGSSKGIFKSIYHLVQSINFRIKYRSIPSDVPHGTWADYGAGTGGFVKYVKDRGQEIKGFEPESAARQNAAQSGITINPTEEFLTNSEQYACITMWHVLEHISNLNEVLQALYDKLLPGGILAIAVPNYKSFDAKWYRTNWAAFDVPRHLWHFSEKDVIALCANHHFQFRYKKALPFDAFYISMLSEGYRNKSKIKGVAIGAISNFYAKFSAYPYSSQTYIFQKSI
ncbi:MAG TPA: class I SAM-dependent methyltransferase [Cryomorphaceae bacterium]|nr:class I SAM-dependent methyltransferase [Cryomorphaceae bacterium]